MVTKSGVKPKVPRFTTYQKEILSRLYKKEPMRYRDVMGEYQCYFKSDYKRINIATFYKLSDLKLIDYWSRSEPHSFTKIVQLTDKGKKLVESNFKEM